MLGTDDYRTEKVHVSPRGGKFRIVNEGMLYKVKSEHGGVLPVFAKTKFTSMKKAEEALQRYFDQNPKPIPRDEKPKIKTEE